MPETSLSIYVVFDATINSCVALVIVTCVPVTVLLIHFTPLSSCFIMSTNPIAVLCRLKVILTASCEAMLSIGI